MASASGCEALGVDLSMRAIELARAKAAERGLPARFAVADALFLPTWVVSSTPCSIADSSTSSTMGASPISTARQPWSRPVAGRNPVVGLVLETSGQVEGDAPIVPAMAILHRATITPTKAELIGQWAPSRTWGPSAADPVTMVGAYRFDDPDGRVGLEAHLIAAGGVLFQIPLTYRDQPLDGGEDALITTMEHSVLGTRWVYDGLGDPRFVVMLAAVTMTGQGEALGIVETEGRLYIAPSNVRIHGGGWSGDRVPVDGFDLVSDGMAASVLQNERFELTVFHRPTLGPRPPIGLTASWEGLGGEAVLAEIRER